jgi:hypothetical protein
MSLAQTCLFMFHFLWVAYRKPHCLILMVSKMKTVRSTPTHNPNLANLQNSLSPLASLAQVQTGDVEVGEIMQAHQRFRKASFAEVKMSGASKVIPQQGK